MGDRKDDAVFVLLIRGVDLQREDIDNAIAVDDGSRMLVESCEQSNMKRWKKIKDCFG